jgi:phosphatidate cytidylyltransferase
MAEPSSGPPPSSDPSGTRGADGAPGIPPELHTPPANSHGRAGRDLPAAIAVGVGVGLVVVLSLLFFNWGFVLFVAAALVLGSIEIHQALLRLGMRSSIIPIVVGTVAIVVGSYFAGQQRPQEVSTNTILLAALGLTVIASLIWRMPRGQDNFVRDTAASLFIIGYVPLLGSFASLMLAGEQGAARIVTYALIVVMSDLGGYVVGVMIGKHPMAPRISPKKSWEGLAGSVAFGVLAGILMAVLGLDASWWVGLILGLVLVAVGVCGDLVESLIKRDVGIKDMSSFLPGHGGVMDRLDSLLFAAPAAWFIMYLLVPGG